MIPDIKLNKESAAMKIYLRVNPFCISVLKSSLNPKAPKMLESLLETGYSVSGISHEVDQYCSDKNVIGHDELGNMKIAYILDNKTSIPPDSSLHFSSMNLQKLFVKLTEKGGK